MNCANVDVTEEYIDTVFKRKNRFQKLKMNVKVIMIVADNIDCSRALSLLSFGDLMRRVLLLFPFLYSYNDEAKIKI